MATRLEQLPLRAILQRLTGVWMICVFFLALFGPLVTPFLYSAYFLGLHVLLFFNQFRTAFAAHETYHSSKSHSTTDWLLKYCQVTGMADGADPRHDLPFDSVSHVIVLPNYKEEMETLCETLDVLASHTRALTQYKVCLAMEESEAGAVAKAKALIHMYTDSFYEVTYTVHPIGLPGEIRGKSSNVAWATREMARRSGGLHRKHEHEVLTVMDADTCFAEDYFTALTFHYCVASPEQRKIMMFCPPTVFDR
jgi:hypothetical protein